MAEEQLRLIIPAMLYRILERHLLWLESAGKKGERADLKNAYLERANFKGAMMESVHRNSDIGVDPQNLDNLLSVERILAHKNKNPEFINTLKQACVIREAEKGWFQNIKDKLFSSVS